jgi:[lysine-biosynthesis-protein LysW]---L-2-aminoadipate ligase
MCESWDMRFALIAQRATPTNDALAGTLVDGNRWELMTPEQALDELRPGDAALGRLDVLPTLDGIDDGMWALGALEARRVVVLNDSGALFATHDKLLTARLLRRADLPHPRTAHVRPDRPFPAVRPPVVVKPRFGSGGQGVTLCDDEEALCDTLSRLSSVEWFEQQGVLVQELVPPQGYDLRILVAGQRFVGAVFRIAAEGEWRTNISLGGSRRPVADPPQHACEIALAAARAVGGALVGVDLIQDGLGNWTIVELNGAVEFTREYQPEGDVFADVSAELMRAAVVSLVGVAAA